MAAWCALRLEVDWRESTRCGRRRRLHASAENVISLAVTRPETCHSFGSLRAAKSGRLRRTVRFAGSTSDKLPFRTRRHCSLSASLARDPKAAIRHGSRRIGGHRHTVLRSEWKLGAPRMEIGNSDLRQSVLSSNVVDPVATPDLLRRAFPPIRERNPVSENAVGKHPESCPWCA